MDKLKIRCENRHIFSFCQEAYVVVIDFKTSTIYSFRRQACKNELGVDIKIVQQILLMYP